MFPLSVIHINKRIIFKYINCVNYKNIILKYNISFLVYVCIKNSLTFVKNCKTTQILQHTHICIITKLRI